MGKANYRVYGPAVSLPSHRLQLPDGRKLGYVDYGEPTGLPVLLFPGTPGSRLQGHPDRSIAATIGVRLIGVDRPGYGLSDNQCKRTLLDWPLDVEVLADHLGLGRFAVLGISGGGPYALTCAWKIPRRLTAVALVSPMGPVADTRAVAGMPWLNRLMLTLAKWGDWPVSLPTAALVTLARRRPDWYLALLNAHLPSVDRDIYIRPPIQTALREDLAEAIRPGRHGAVRDIVLFANPWPFSLQEIRVPLQLWHGEQDATVPVQIGREIATALPRCQARFLPDAGHLLIIDRWREILADLRQAIDSAQARKSA